VRNLSACWQITLATLRRRYASLLTFAGVAAVFHIIVAASFPFIGGMDSVQSVLQTFPPGLRQLLKLAPNLQAGFGLIDYLSFTWIHPFFVGLCAAFAVGRSAEALAGEIETGSVYLLLSRPVPRWTLVVGKVGEMAFGLGVILVVSWLGLVIGAGLGRLGPLPVDRYLLVIVMAWPLFTSLGGVALIVSSVSSRVGIAVAIGTIWTLVTFVLDVIPALAGSSLAWLNPWHHYFPQEIIVSNSVDVTGLIILIVWIIASTLIAITLFARRDLV
jgi:ABC-type transport system involved in multi-copper enzyme maturation permease subunit